MADFTKANKIIQSSIPYGAVVRLRARKRRMTATTATMVSIVVRPMLFETRLSARYGAAVVQILLVRAMASGNCQPLVSSWHPPSLVLAKMQIQSMGTDREQAVSVDVLCASKGVHAPLAKTPWRVRQNASSVQIHLRSSPQPAAAMVWYAGY